MPGFSSSRALFACTSRLHSFHSLLCPEKVKHLGGCTSGPLIAPLVGMDYEKMKALMEASREESAVQGQPKVNEFPKPDSWSDWKYLGYVAKERIAA
jgi:hypothetical protein